MGTDEIDYELFVLVVCDESCDVVVFCADFELVEEEGEDPGVIIGVSSVSTATIVVSIMNPGVGMTVPRRWS